MNEHHLLIKQLHAKNSFTKSHTQKHRAQFALNRNTAGFTLEHKEITYTLVCDKSNGAYVSDLDENDYIDLTMGFGSVLFGHNYPPIREAIQKQMSKSWSVGPISPLAGILADKISKATPC
jgi:glutamate-1-semialdehyde aminotransferase